MGEVLHPPLPKKNRKVPAEEILLPPVMEDWEEDGLPVQNLLLPLVDDEKGSLSSSSSFC